MPEGLNEQAPVFHRSPRVEELGKVANAYIDGASTQAALAFSDPDAAQRAYSVNELLLLQKRNRLVEDIRNLRIKQTNPSEN